MGRPRRFLPESADGFSRRRIQRVPARVPAAHQLSILPDFAAQAQPYASLYPDLASRVRRFSLASASGAGFAYVNFLNNAFHFLPFLKRHDIPFVLTLYPGGGFGIDEPASDAKLARICASPCLKHMIVTQSRTDAYIGNRHSHVPRTFVFGCVINPMYLAEDSAQRTWFGHGKATLDVCFVAEKYMAHGSNKGFPAFVDAARQVASAIPGARLHVCGGFTPDDWPLAELSGRMQFHGRLATRELRTFFAAMDIVASPNVPFVISPGNFDGFPTAACTEASLCGVAMVVSDVLGFNLHYDSQTDLVIAQPGADAFAEAIISLGRDSGRLRAIALAGRRKSQALFAPERQIEPRIAVLRREAGAIGVAL